MIFENIIFRFCISAESILESINVHIDWISLIESFSMPKRKSMACEFQLGRRGLYPLTGGGGIFQETYLPKAFSKEEALNNQCGPKKKLFKFNIKSKSNIEMI